MRLPLLQTNAPIFLLQEIVAPMLLLQVTAGTTSRAGSGPAGLMNAGLGGMPGDAQLPFHARTRRKSSPERRESFWTGLWGMGRTWRVTIYEAGLGAVTPATDVLILTRGHSSRNFRMGHRTASTSGLDVSRLSSRDRSGRTCFIAIIAG